MNKIEQLAKENEELKKCIKDHIEEGYCSLDDEYEFISDFDRPCTDCHARDLCAMSKKLEF